MSIAFTDAASARHARIAGPSTLALILRRAATWVERARSRRALREMDARMLSDIGVTRADAVLEAGKPWWRA